MNTKLYPKNVCRPFEKFKNI